MSSNQRWAWKSLQFASLGVPVNHRCFVDGPQRVPKFIYYNPETWNQITKGKKLGVFWRLTLQFTELAHLLVLTAVSSPLTSSILSSACLCLFPAALLYVMVQVLASYLHCLTHTHTWIQALWCEESLFVLLDQYSSRDWDSPWSEVNTNEIAFKCLQGSQSKWCSG